MILGRDKLSWRISVGWLSWLYLLGGEVEWVQQRSSAALSRQVTDQEMRY